MLPKLPWRGLGLSSNLSTLDVPHPYRLLDAEPGLFDFVEYSAPLDVAEARAEASLFPEMWARRADVPVLFHPVHLNLWGPELEPPEALAALDAHAREVGSPWVGNDVGWWHAGGQPFPGYLYLTPPLTAAQVEDCAAHALHVQGHLSVPLALENPAVLARRGELHVLDFMARLHARTGLPLIVDLGHLLSHQLASGLAPTTGLDGFPCEAVIEVHLAGGVVTRRGGRGVYVDDHTQPVREELFALLEALLPRCPALRAVTFEGDGHPPEIAALTLRRLRRLVPAGPRPDVAPPTPVVPPAPAALSDRETPWRLFDEGHGAAEPREDPAGAEADRDFRLAVVAEQLDQDWPLTRLLLAGTRERLTAFTASAEYRALFEGLGRGLPAAFARWARKALRAAPDDGVAAALALETGLPALFQRAAPAPAPGRVGLARDARVGTFPLDLGELVFAARALRRHLTGRAWACEALELSGLEALAQVAHRPAPGPWTYAARRTPRGRVEVLTLTRELGALLRQVAGGQAEEGTLAPGPLAEALSRGLVRRG